MSQGSLSDRILGLSRLSFFHPLNYSHSNGCYIILHRNNMHNFLNIFTCFRNVETEIIHKLPNAIRKYGGHYSHNLLHLNGTTERNTVA